MPRFSLRLRVVVSIAFLLAVAPVAAQWFVSLANGSAIFGGAEAPEGLTAVLANLPWSEWAIVFGVGHCIYRRHPDRRLDRLVV